MLWLVSLAGAARVRACCSSSPWLPGCRLITSSRLNTPELLLAEVKRVGLRIQAAKPIGEHSRRLNRLHATCEQLVLTPSSCFHPALATLLLPSCLVLLPVQPAAPPLTPAP